MATTPYPFVSGAVLTASQLNSTYNVPVSTKTASYTLVAADGGTRVTMNSASATTITVNDSLFSAGDSVLINNTAAGGVCTITAGTCAVTTSGSLVLAVNAGGTLYFTSASAAIFFASGGASGLNFITSGTVTAGSALSFDNCFSATYANYLIMLTHTAGNNPTMRLRASGADITAANYGLQGFFITGGAQTLINAATTTSWTISNGTGFSQPAILLGNPFATTVTAISDDYRRTDALIMQMVGGFYNATTSADGFSILGTTITVTARVYGYQNS